MKTKVLDLTNLKIKIKRLTEAENFAAGIWGIKEGLEEMMGPRADNNHTKTQLYKQISQQGYCNLADLEDNIEDKYTLNTTNVFLLGCGIQSDLVSDTLELPRTIEERKRRKSTSERISDKTIRDD